MFSTYKVAFYTTTYRYHVKRQDIGQHVRLIIAHIYNGISLCWNGRRNSLHSCGWELVDGTGASHYFRAVSCPDRRSVHTRCRALCSFIKKHRNSSKLDSCVLYSFAHCACSPRCMYNLVFNQVVRAFHAL